MELEIRPEPTEDVRAAIAAALRPAGAPDAVDGRDGAGSAWWRAGLEEAIRAEPERATW